MNCVLDDIMELSIILLGVQIYCGHVKNSLLFSNCILKYLEGNVMLKIKKKKSSQFEIGLTLN